MFTFFFAEICAVVIDCLRAGGAFSEAALPGFTCALAPAAFSCSRTS
jgi:hypothetical protein